MKRYSINRTPKRSSWYERLIYISRTVLLLDSYYQNFRDARDTMDRLVDKHQTTERQTRTLFQHHWFQ